MENKVKDPFFRISRRESITHPMALLIRLVAIVCSLLVCALVIYLLTEMNPISVYKGIIDGALGTNKRIWVTIRDTMTLLCIGLALAPAFKMRFWNIGAEGQVLMGALVTAAVMIYCNDMPTWAIFALMIVGSIFAGMVWGLIPAVFKAVWNTNETLFTLMLNYVAMQLVTYSIVYWENPKGSNSVGIINMLGKQGWLPAVFSEQYALNVLIVLSIAVLMFFYLRYSKHGYEISVVGESERTALYAGINVKWVIMRTMMISGALCGLAGFILVSGSSHTISTSTAGGRGFTAIIVAWLSKFNSFVMILVSFFLVFMEKGAGQIATQFNLSENASDIITGIILFFILGCEFFINYKVTFRRRAGKELE